ncbi:MAG: heterodisulfide reductase [Gammaproteobacteria bacterium]|nr:MAG: heterodisulfide reductase [Gammaproteobacteria bacterium]
MAEEIKTGCYICTGCGIGERLDDKQMQTIATRDGKAKFVKSHQFLCSDDGVKTINDDIKSEQLNRLVIAGCSRRAKMNTFEFDNIPTSRANIREGVIWVRPDNDESSETTQEMANDYIRMACAEARTMKQVAPSEEQSTINKNILIVGGGIAGLTAAIEASKAGYQSSIVEKSGKLGGFVANLYKSIPHKSPYNEPQETQIENLIKTAEDDRNITIYLDSIVSKTEGAPGRFEADITKESGASKTHKFGAIIQNNGFTQFDANILDEFSYKTQKNVITQSELESIAKKGKGKIQKPDGKGEIKTAVFIQCAGQRSDKENHLSYCSGFCCSTSIKQAMYFKEQNPDIDTIIMYDDLRVPGVAGEDFYRAGQKKGIVFSKAKVSQVTGDGDNLKVEFKDLILDEDTAISADLVVLATGLVANSGPDPYATPIELDADGKEIENPEVQKIDVTESVLNLQYRQGTDLPHLKNGFTDSHFICFPYETRRTGIYAAGPVRRPMDILQTKDDATGAVMRAISVIENSNKGRAQFPRSGDLSFPEFRKEGCTQCKRCTVECPFGAINEDEKGYPIFNEARCRRCGTCMGACPVRVISFANYSVETVNQQIKNCDMPDEFDEKPRILVLACENDAYPALDMAAQNRIEYSAYARIIPVRCLGSTSVSWITDALNSGYDGIVMMGCKKGDDYQCHFVKGSEMAHERMAKVGDTLESLQLESERVAVHEVAISDIQTAPALIEDMAKVVEKVGMNPFKF